MNITVDDFSSICRVCLSSKSLSKFTSLEIFKLYKNITNIEVKENDELPDNICRICAQRLHDIKLFIEQCIVSHSQFIVALEQIPIGISSDFDDIFIEDVSMYKHEILEEAEMKQNFNEGGETFECAICNMKFMIKKLLIHHMNIHNNNRDTSENENVLHANAVNDNIDLAKKSKYKRKCEACGKLFHTSFVLFKHIKLVHSRTRESKAGNSFNCSKCDRVLTSQSALDSHMKTHTGDRPYKCNYCEKDFPYLSSLTVHTRLHTGETPYICSICKKGFHSSTNLKKHKETKHSVEEAYIKEKNEKNDLTEDLNKIKCSVCNKMFSKHGYGTHIRVHSNEKKMLFCTICNKKFKKNSHLERHMRIHTGERPYSCNICKKRFTQDGDLKRHISIHSGQKDFQCQHCGKQFFTKSSLNTHFLNHIGVKIPRNLECSICNKPASECNQDSHPRQVPKCFLCTICGKSFTASSTLKIHHRLHTGENPFECKYCSKAYNNSSALKGHIRRTHTGEKPHRCVVCQKRFHDSTNLKRHFNRVHSVVDVNQRNKSIDIVNDEIME